MCRCMPRAVFYFQVLWILLAVLGEGARADDPPKLPVVAPAEAGLDVARLSWIDSAVEQAIARGEMPGCVVAVGHQGKLGWFKAYGDRQVEPETVPMTVDAVFDLASLTKPIATATSVMLLVERGQIRLRDAVADHLPPFGQNGKEAITIEQLLTHQSGLIPDNPLSDYGDGAEMALQRIYALELTAPPGERFIYSDVNYIVLAELVRFLTGRDVHQFTQEHVFQPLGMSATGYLPAPELRARAAPTEQRGGQWMQGEVHDPRAFALGGVAGHAGLFSTAEDLAVYAQMLLGRGQYAERRVLSEAAVEKMTRDYEVSRGRRGLGWDKMTGYSSNRGELMSPAAFGHGGFTGTGIWIDPEHQLFVIFLSNRLHPDGEGTVNPLIGRIGSIAVSSIADPQEADDAATAVTPETNGSTGSGVGRNEVLTGLDVLRRDNFARLRGRRVGLITNHTGIARDGTSIVSLLHQAAEVELVTLFSPEHGFDGTLDVPRIDDTTEAATGIAVRSLYGEVRKPRPEDLADIDTLVFDIQDIGTRFYTYVSTMGLAMEAVHELRRDTGRSIPFIVLDRPNPIDGVHVAGPVLDPGAESFVGFHAVAVRHGMTAGELALMFQNERQWNVELEVIPMEGWRRGMMFDETNLPWRDPSPNMRSMDAAVLYPGIGLLETTNLSVGRGTDTPFEVFGAPWLDPLDFARRLQEAGIPGVRFVPFWFTPESSVFAGERCGGVRMVIVNRAELDPLLLGWHIARNLREGYPDDWQVDKYGRLLGDAAVHESVRNAESAEAISATYRTELAQFLARRAKYLLYPEGVAGP